VTGIEGQYLLAGHLLEHARDHVVVLAAAGLADLVRRHHPDASVATLTIADGVHYATLTAPSLPESVRYDAARYAGELTDETWAMWEGFADEDQTSSPQTGPRVLALDLDRAAQYPSRLPDPSGANCPRTCVLWREEGEGVPDLGPCHACGAPVEENCRPQCPDPVRPLRADRLGHVEI
jgi:hypothetical protein